MKATINDRSTYEVSQEGETIMLNGKDFEWDKAQITDTQYHVLKNNKSYNAEIVETNYQEKMVRVKVNGEIHVINFKDKTDELLAQMGVAAGSASKLANLKAPMPGLIYELKVAVGDTVQKGDVLLILVAMKMENAIKASGNGKVKAIKVNINDSVEKNQVIMEFE